MKSSRTSLNKPFYDWIKEVREADKKISELEDMLYYYNVKLIGYNSPNFEPRLSSTKPEYKDNRYIWIEKIEKTEVKILYQKNLIFEFKNFKNKLTTTQLSILNDLFYLQNNEKYSKSYWYRVISDLSKIYLKSI